MGGHRYPLGSTIPIIHFLYLRGSNLGLNIVFEIPIGSSATSRTTLYFIELYVRTPPLNILPIANIDNNIMLVNYNSFDIQLHLFPNIQSSYILFFIIYLSLFQIMLCLVHRPFLGLKLTMQIYTFKH